jgi:hypothetical protein
MMAIVAAHASGRNAQSECKTCGAVDRPTEKTNLANLLDRSGAERAASSGPNCSPASATKAITCFFPVACLTSSIGALGS